VTATKPTLHQDGTVTYWSVSRQRWIPNAAFVPQAELAAMDPEARSNVRAHLRETTLTAVACGNRLKAARRAAGWSQKDAAAAIGITPPSLCRYESGRCVPGWIVLDRLVRVLKLDPKVFWPELFWIPNDREPTDGDVSK
jgi:DNA-binding XRE family transcriptional regulator